MTARLIIEGGRTWVRLIFTAPVLELAVLQELEQRLDELAHGQAPRPLILASAHQSIFSAGAHLAEIAALDATSSVGYAAAGRAVMARLDRFPCATIAAVEGSCSGGGFDLVLSCDRVVAGPSATFAHPGVRRGLVTGWGGTVRLPVVVGRMAALRTFLQATEIGAEAAEASGLVTLSRSDVAANAVQLAERLTGLHPARLAAWRRLRDLPREPRWDPACDTGYNCWVHERVRRRARAHDRECLKLPGSSDDQDNSSR